MKLGCGIIIPSSKLNIPVHAMTVISILASSPCSFTVVTLSILSALAVEPATLCPCSVTTATSENSPVVMLASLLCSPLGEVEHAVACSNDSSRVKNNTFFIEHFLL